MALSLSTEVFKSRFPKQSSVSRLPSQPSDHYPTQLSFFPVSPICCPALWTAMRQPVLLQQVCGWVGGGGWGVGVGRWYCHGPWSKWNGLTQRSRDQGDQSVTDTMLPSETDLDSVCVNHSGEWLKGGKGPRLSLWHLAHISPGREPSKRYTRQHRSPFN